MVVQNGQKYYNQPLSQQIFKQRSQPVTTPIYLKFGRNFDSSNHLNLITVKPLESGPLESGNLWNRSTWISRKYFPIRMNLWNRGNSNNRGIGAKPENLILSACIELILKSPTQSGHQYWNQLNKFLFSQ